MYDGGKLMNQQVLPKQLKLIAKSLNFIKDLVESFQNQWIIVKDLLHIIGQLSTEQILQSIIQRLMYLQANIHLTNFQQI